MEQSLKSSAINYGLYLGIFSIATTLIAYAVNLGLLANMWYGILILLVIIAIGVISVAKAKGILNGFISFKQAFTSYFLTILIGLAISTGASYLLFNFIDPEAAVELQKVTIEATITGMERWNLPAEAIAEAVDNIENQDQWSLGSIFKGFAIYLAVFSVIGLIVAAIMKRKDPDQA